MGKIKLTKAQELAVRALQTGMRIGRSMRVWENGSIRGKAKWITIDSLVKKGLIELDKEESWYVLTPLGKTVELPE